MRKLFDEADWSITSIEIQEVTGEEYDKNIGDAI